MENNIGNNIQFEKYTEYQSNRLRYLILNLMYENKDIKNALQIANIFLKEIVKPTWFEDDIKTVKDIYDYICFTYENWDKQIPLLRNHKIKILYPEDVITEEQKIILRNLINEIKDFDFNIKSFPVAYQKIYKGQPIKDLDINCISKKSYEFILSFLLEIKNRGHLKVNNFSNTNKKII